MPAATCSSLQPLAGRVQRRRLAPGQAQQRNAATGAVQRIEQTEELQRLLARLGRDGQDVRGPGQREAGRRCGHDGSQRALMRSGGQPACSLDACAGRPGCGSECS